MENVRYTHIPNKCHRNKQIDHFVALQTHMAPSINFLHHIDIGIYVCVCMYAMRHVIALVLFSLISEGFLASFMYHTYLMGECVVNIFKAIVGFMLCGMICSCFFGSHYSSIFFINAHYHFAQLKSYV